MAFKLIFVILTLTSSYMLYKLLIEPHPVPIIEDQDWGSSTKNSKGDDKSINPFQINISVAVINDLKSRLRQELDSNRLATPLEGTGFNYGFNSKFLLEVGQYWLEKYDWKKREALLNKYPHFKTKIGGLDIHFQHIKPESQSSQSSKPILVLHGWPGSFVEFQKIIPLLSEPKNAKYNYELIIPSLPGYGFSSASRRSGLSTTEIANIFKRLMTRLGHDKFFIMGGDWGALITSDMATIYPNNVIAAQSNLCNSLTVMTHVRYVLATLLPSFLMSSDEERDAVLPLLELASFITRESGYFHLQATKPDTVGVALSHSPLGLAAYILEKFSTWTNRSWIDKDDGGIPINFKLDELLDNVMVYWVTGTITTSMRLYAENMNPSKLHKLDRVPTSVPFSCLYMREEFFIYPKFALENKYTNITKYTIAPSGGHFGAFEMPKLVAENAISHFENY